MTKPQKDVNVNKLIEEVLHKLKKQPRSAHTNIPQRLEAAYKNKRIVWSITNALESHGIDIQALRLIELLREHSKNENFNPNSLVYRFLKRKPEEILEDINKIKALGIRVPHIDALEKCCKSRIIGNTNINRPQQQPEIVPSNSKVLDSLAPVFSPSSKPVFLVRSSADLGTLAKRLADKHKLEKEKKEAAARKHRA